MPRRSELIPWKAAGRVSEQMASGDDVVRETGWVFNNETGSELTLAEFVATGDEEVPAYLETFGIRSPENEHRTLVEIGAGIGRMTCAFTREFGSVVACDLDPGFLERCYETVGRFGKVERLRTVEVADGRTLDIGTDTADVAFSYITFQHCDAEDAMALAAEAVRVVRPGGKVVLNFRGPSGSDPVVIPAGALVRSLYRPVQPPHRQLRVHALVRGHQRQALVARRHRPLIAPSSKPGGRRVGAAVSLSPCV
jgi:SAM-dependent methyltransferase